MKETLERCHKLLVAMKTEMENLSAVPNNEAAKTLATMKLNLTGYIQSIWPSRSAFEADIAQLEAAQHTLAPDVCPADGGRHDWRPLPGVNYLNYACIKCGVPG